MNHMAFNEKSYHLIVIYLRTPSLILRYNLVGEEKNYLVEVAIY